MTRFCLAVLLVANAAGCLWAEEWTKTFAVTAVPDLRIETNDASIHVAAGQQNRIEARVVTEGWRIADDEIRVTETQSGDRVAIEVHVPQLDWQFFNKQRRSVRIEISAPAKANLDLRTGDGGVSLRGVSGTAQVHTSDGSITAEDLRGEIRLSSNDGSIDVRRLAGTIRASSSDGAIEVRDTEGEVELATSDGRIQAVGMQAALRARTNDGRVDVDGRFNLLELLSGDGSVTATVREGSHMQGDWRLTSRDGSIDLRLPRTFPAELDAQTGDGRVTIDFPVTVSGSLSRSRIHGTIQQGGPRLELRTGDGSIHVQRL
jgi:DUF4097 and DUF4098 domain-containing protein YvlB